MQKDFVTLLARELRRTDGSAIVVDLAGAVDRLYESVATLECDAGCCGKCRRAAKDGAAGVPHATAAEYRRARTIAMQETDRATRGHCFRLETSRGPVFEWSALWRFAGQSGIEEGEKGGDPWWAAKGRRASEAA